jgi:hypothetical protein
MTAALTCLHVPLATQLTGMMMPLQSLLPSSSQYTDSERAQRSKSVPPDLSLFLGTGAGLPPSAAYQLQQSLEAGAFAAASHQAANRVRSGSVGAAREEVEGHQVDAASDDLSIMQPQTHRQHAGHVPVRYKSVFSFQSSGRERPCALCSEPSILATRDTKGGKRECRMRLAGISDIP